MAPPHTELLTGLVIEGDDSVVCAAPPDTGATGQCFVRDGVTASMREGDCVTVTYHSPEPPPPGPFTAKDVRRADCADD